MSRAYGHSPPLQIPVGCRQHSCCRKPKLVARSPDTEAEKHALSKTALMQKSENTSRQSPVTKMSDYRDRSQKRSPPGEHVLNDQLRRQFADSSPSLASEKDNAHGARRDQPMYTTSCRAAHDFVNAHPIILTIVGELAPPR